MFYLVGLIALMGAIGGVINALLSDNGFFMPKRLQVDDQVFFRPGFLGNTLVGAVSSFVSWALYGPLASVVIAGSSNGTASNSAAQAGVTLSSLGGAVLIGVAGSRWLTNEIDKTILKSASVVAARSQASTTQEKEKVQSLANNMALASSPSQILRLADDLPKANVGIGHNTQHPWSFLGSSTDV
jgi:hypothetical protein